MSEEQYLYLQHSESVVANMSATILAAFINNNTLNPQNEDELVEKAVSLATKLAVQAEKVIKSDEEWINKERALDNKRHSR